MPWQNDWRKSQKSCGHPNYSTYYYSTSAYYGTTETWGNPYGAGNDTGSTTEGFVNPYAANDNETTTTTQDRV